MHVALGSTASSPPSATAVNRPRGAVFPGVGLPPPSEVAPLPPVSAPRHPLPAQNELQYIRFRCQKHEVMAAPGRLSLHGAPSPREMISRWCCVHRKGLDGRHSFWCADIYIVVRTMKQYRDSRRDSHRSSHTHTHTHTPTGPDYMVIIIQRWSSASGV